MKLIHVSDLHIGKGIHGISMLDNGDQPYWIEGFLDLVKKEKPQAVLIAGDVYDRANPPREAIEAVDKLLTDLSRLDFKPAVMMVAGNHDSGSLVGYLKGIAAMQNIHVAGNHDKEAYRVTLEDEFGPVDFWLVPYVFPAIINQLFDTDFRSYDEAFRYYLGQQGIDFSRRNVIVSHQNITASGKEAERGGSETMVGGVGGIDYTAFDGFEYAALGHIHAAQPVGRPEVRYAGSPLCYHFDETKHARKGPVVVTLDEKGSATDIRIEEIKPLHPLREIRGTLEDIENNELSNPVKDEFVRVILLPDNDGMLPAHASVDDRLRSMFRANGSWLLDISYEYGKRAAAETTEESVGVQDKLSLDEQFEKFWELRYGGDMNEDLSEIMKLIAGQSESAGRRIPTDKKLSKEEEKDIAEIVTLAKKLGGADK